MRTFQWYSWNKGSTQHEHRIKNAVKIQIMIDTWFRKNSQTNELVKSPHCKKLYGNKRNVYFRDQPGYEHEQKQ